MLGKNKEKRIKNNNMKVKIIKSMSKFFKVGQIVEMDMSNSRGDFRLYKPNSFSQSFGFLLHDHLRPVTKEELEERIK